ncbi:Plant transposon protein [Fragilaria crotonensis]|nr:Plant transposon protein [Fragilaria crotonensis]
MQEDYEDEEKRKLFLALANMVGESARKRKRGAMADAQRRIRAAKKTRVARSRWYTDPVTRVKRKKTPKMSAWWEDFIQDPRPEDKHWAKEFRQNFRLPYASYVMLLDMISSDASIGLFDRWIKAYERKHNNKNKKVSPIELLLLGSLRYLGRGWTFDDMKDVTYISRDVHRKFFHQFMKFGAKVLYPMYVSTPRTVEELRECEREYSIAGFPGCIGSTDATHIPLEKVCMSMRQAHLGHKSKVTMRTYNLTCNHRRKILHTTEGHPARWNDKTLIRFDNFMTELRDGALNENLTSS